MRLTEQQIIVQLKTTDVSKEEVRRDLKIMEVKGKDKTRTAVCLYLRQSLQYCPAKIHKASESTRECENLLVVLKKSLIISISATL